MSYFHGRGLLALVARSLRSESNRIFVRTSNGIDANRIEAMRVKAMRVKANRIESNRIEASRFKSKRRSFFVSVFFLFC